MAVKDAPPRSIKSLFMAEGDLEKHNWKLKEKFDTIKKNELLYETQNTEDADIILVAFGIAARVAKSAMRTARENKIKVGLVRPMTLWPFPEKVISDLAAKNKKFLVLEMNVGQMIEDVKLAVNGKAPVEFLGRPGGGLLNDKEVLEKIEQL